MRGAKQVLEAFVTIGWIVAGVFVVALSQRETPALDRRYVWYCFWAHVASAFALIWLTYGYFEGGDMQMYYRYGDALGDFVVDDPFRWGPEVVKLILQMPADLPIRVYGHEGSSTTTMSGITSLVMIGTGSSEYATGIVYSLFAFSGQVKMYAAFRDQFPPRYRKRLLVAILLIPSAVFWTSGVVKEAVAMGGLGWLVWGLYCWIVAKRRLAGVLWIGFGAVVVSISKGYVLFPAVAGAGIWWFWHHSLTTRGSVGMAAKPLYLIGGCAVAMLGMIGLGELFPEYSVDQFAEETAELQERGQRVTGGSSYTIGDPSARSLGGQLAFAPVAVTASLFRPFLFEAHNAAAFVNGLEMTVVALLWIRILWARGLRGTWRWLRTSPVLMFCLVFVLLFSLGVGLATTNLGTLSRYRVPMMPMYGLLLLMLLPMKDRTA